jgi:hypothetical protein
LSPRISTTVTTMFSSITMLSFVFRDSTNMTNHLLRSSSLGRNGTKSSEPKGDNPHEGTFSPTLSVQRMAAKPTSLP